MKTVGLIAEYNPFHKGHAYHIQKSKEICNAECAVVIMSGNYVQRGEPAFVDKYTRTEIALNHGADLVIELPIVFSTASAEWFAAGAISILNSLGCIDYLCFGSEDENLSDFMQIAQILNNEPNDFKILLKEHLKTGSSFPAARQKALSDYLSQNQSFDFECLKKPNNILGIEYLKALLKYNSKIEPRSILRIEADYHSTENSDCFFSASALRNLSDNAQYQKALLEIDAHYLKNFQRRYPIHTNDFSLLLGQRLLTCQQNHSLHKIFDIGEDFANSIYRETNNYKDWISFAQTLKNKNRTYSAISRGLLHILLDISEDLIQKIKADTKLDYIRVLGFHSKGKALLHEIKKHSNICILTKVAHYQQLLEAHPLSLEVFEKNMAADALYRMVAMNKFHSDFPDEYTQKLIVKNS